MPELIEGLYVSPTAWAMWDYEKTDASFNIYLNDKLVEENYTNKYYQFDVASLVEGKEYTTTILPKNEYVMFDYVKSVTVYTEYSDAYLVINGVSTSKTVSDLNYTVYPVKSDDKISLEYKVDDEIFSSNSIIVGDNNSLYFNEFVGLDNYLIEETYIYNFESNL